MSKRKQDRARQRVLLAPELPPAAVVELADGDLPVKDRGRTFRKKILPLGEIQYPKTRQHPGGKVVFDHAYHQKIIDAFQDKAYDNPTLQLASGGVEHNADVKLTAGSIVDLSHERPDDTEGPGLYATIRAHSRKDAKLIRRNPHLGVSPEIHEFKPRVDGKVYPAALHHVLATLRGRVAGLGPWRAVSLSSTEDGPVLDLSASTIKGQHMGKKQKNKDRVVLDGDDVIVSLSDDEIEDALEEAARLFDGDVTDEPRVGRRVSLSDDEPRYVDLATDVAETRTELGRMTSELTASKWAAKREALSAAGVPRTILALAEDVLAYPGSAVLSLSDEDGDQFIVDARKTIEDILEQCRGIIDLSDDVRGSGAEPDYAAAAPEQLDAALAAWAARSGS